MTFDEALELGSRGVRVCRPGFGEEFCLVQEGRIVRGGFMGEASLARVRFWEPSPEDRQALDWRRFRRELPDEWDGCDMPTAGQRIGPDAGTAR